MGKELLSAAKLAVALLAVVTFAGLMRDVMKSLAASLESESPMPADTAPAPPPTPVDWSWLPWAVVIIIGVIGFTIVGVVVVQTMSGRRRARAVRNDTRAAQVSRWEVATDEMNSVLGKIAAFETSPEDVCFTRPLLADVSEPSTAEFYAALERVQVMHVDAAPHDEKRIDDFAAAVSAASRAFNVADDNALRKARDHVVSGSRRLTYDERRRVRQAHAMLLQALDDSTPLELARTSYAKAMGILDSVGSHVPERLHVEFVNMIESPRRDAITM